MIDRRRAVTEIEGHGFRPGSNSNLVRDNAAGMLG
jgi:hypothetical protein